MKQVRILTSIKMQIIRIEHPKDENGLYRSCDNDEYPICNKFSFYYEMCDKHSKLPTPYEENLPFDSRYFCAFKSLQKFYKWIPFKYISEILQYGFRIYIIEIDIKHCLVGKEQICYQKENIVSKTDISDLFVNIK